MSDMRAAGGLGQDADAAATTSQPASAATSTLVLPVPTTLLSTLAAAPTVSSVSEAIIGAASIGSSALGFYHGFKRNGDSFGWGLWWGVMGAIFPVIVPGYAFAQGFGEPIRS